MQASCIVCGHAETKEGGGEGGGRSAGGVRAAGNSRSGAATPVTSVGASANQ